MFESIVSEREVNFNKIEKEVFKFVCNLGCMIIRTISETNDQVLLKTRDKEMYRNKSNECTLS